MESTGGAATPTHVVNGPPDTAGAEVKDPEVSGEADPARRSAIPLLLRQSLPGLVVAMMTVRVLEPVRDIDTFWHIKAGDLLRSSWHFVTDDPWGAGTSEPWILNQWLGQLVMSWSNDLLGLAGVAWLLSFAVATLLVTTWWICRRHTSLLLSAAIMAVAFLAMSGSVSPRPQMVTFALTMVWVEAWLRTTNDGVARWWLVPLAWIWAASHGLWFIGVLIGLLTLVGMGLERQHTPAQLGRLALIPLASVVMAAATPVGPGLLMSPLQVQGVTKYITEWQPPSPTDPSFLAMLALLAIPVLGALRRPRRMPWPVLLLLGLALGLGLMYSRTVAVAAAIAVPIVAASLSSLLPLEPIRHREVVITSFLAVGALALAGLLAPVRAAEPGYGAPTLDAALGDIPRDTVLCNAWADGGWLIWRHPNIRVTMDSRVELYTVDHIKQYLTFVTASPGWQAFPARLDCTYALLPESMPVVEALRAQEDWTEIATGNGRALLRAP